MLGTKVEAKDGTDDYTTALGLFSNTGDNLLKIVENFIAVQENYLETVGSGIYLASSTVAIEGIERDSEKMKTLCLCESVKQKLASSEEFEQFMPDYLRVSVNAIRLQILLISKKKKKQRMMTWGGFCFLLSVWFMYPLLLFTIVYQALTEMTWTNLALNFPVSLIIYFFVLSATVFMFFFNVPAPVFGLFQKLLDLLAPLIWCVQPTITFRGLHTAYNDVQYIKKPIMYTPKLT